MPWPIAAFTAGVVFAWDASNAAAYIEELTYAAEWAWAWVPLPSAQQWQPRTIITGHSADIIPIHPAIS
jgi:hypothetical protein